MKYLKKSIAYVLAIPLGCLIILGLVAGLILAAFLSGASLVEKVTNTLGEWLDL